MREFLDDLDAAKGWLDRCGFRDPIAAHRRIRRIAESGAPLDLLESLCRDLAQVLPGCADADMALNNLERMIESVRSPLSMLTFLERKPHSLAVLVQIFAASQYFSDVLVENPECFDFLWEAGAAPLDPERLREEVLAEVRSVQFDLDRVLSLVRRVRNRELVRIGYRDVVLGEPLDRVTRSISDLADALVQSALAVAYHRQSAKFGEPRAPGGAYSRLAVLALGKLGGQELNYSSDVDLLLVYDDDGMTDGASPRESISNSEFFAAVVREVVHVLSANTPQGVAYRVDLRLRPHGRQSALCLSLADAAAYYERLGRTWERQMLVKARPVAGSRRLGEKFLEAIRPFVYRRYLSFVEINEMKAIKRRIERQSEERSRDAVNVKTGRGGVRDIEFVVQFLQLLHGGVHPELRKTNTLAALKALLSVGCINVEEHAALETAYRFLRKTEHRLQFMFDLQKHTLPESPDERDRLARRLGYASGLGMRPGEEFLADLDAIMKRNQTILKHLMTELFTESPDGDAADGGPEADLILDPEPSFEQVEQVLGKYPFQNVREAYKNLMLLAEEEAPFLSSIRCRHFLASAAPYLLRAIGQAADADMALVNLEKVTRSLGAKGVLWESLGHSPPLLKLYVDLCAGSQFLSEILVNNPGMVDELLETLVMNRSPTRDEWKQELDRLLKGARDVDPILHGFKNTALLAIGVNDVTGRRSLEETTAALSDLADVVLQAVANVHWRALVEERGEPALHGRPSEACWYALVGLGKLGGRELGYHGDLDLLFLYEDDGQAAAADGPQVRSDATSNYGFFTEFLQRVLKTTGQLTPNGKLYTIDLRLRPAGRSGSLVSSLPRFRKYFERDAHLWERQCLTRARVVHAGAGFEREVERALKSAAVGAPWRPSMADEILQMRRRLEASRPPDDVKRGVGGQADVEFAVQTTQIRRGREVPEILVPNILDAIARIRECGLWPAGRCDTLASGYRLLRTVESRLRIVYNVAKNQLPADPRDMDKLAHRTGHGSGDALLAELRTAMASVRAAFLECVDEARRG